MPKEITLGDFSQKAELGDTINLKDQKQKVVECKESGVLMVNIDADQLKIGDLTIIKRLGLTISNPETTEPIALGVELKKTISQRLASFFDTDEEDEDDDDDDSSFFNPSSGGFFGSRSSGGFGGFGGFGGGSFGGAGASRGF